jgi:hypothetical protein
MRRPEMMQGLMGGIDRLSAPARVLVRFLILGGVFSATATGIRLPAEIDPDEPPKVLANNDAIRSRLNDAIDKAELDEAFLIQTVAWFVIDSAKNYYPEHHEEIQQTLGINTSRGFLLQEG